jgi:hypothetical protein
LIQENLKDENALLLGISKTETPGASIIELETTLTAPLRL